MIACCILAKHTNNSTERAIQSALRFGLEVYLGLTHDQIPARTDIRAFPILWQNDFANARNQLLDQVKNRFVLWIDSDEELFSFPQYNWDVFQENIFYVRTQFNSPFTPRVHIRMHRNIPHIRWQERIHERISALKPELYTSRFISSLIIRHYGYEEDELVLKKHSRNLEIAQKGLDQTPLYSELLAQARAETATGQPNFIHWLGCYKKAIATSDLRTQPSYFGFEPAFLMCIAGYAKPAEELLEKNPLNIYLQLAVLAHGYKYAHTIDDKRLNFLETCLQNGFYDVYENFPRELLGASKNQIMTHIQTWVGEWKEPMIHPPIFQETARYQSVKEVDEQTFDDDLLLMHQKIQKVVVINPTSSVLWRLLESPITLHDLTSLLHEADPSTSLDLQKESVKTLLKELLNAALIVPV